MAYRDAADFVLTTLQNTSDVTDLVMEGIEGVYESGDLDPKTLEEEEKLRMEGDTPDMLLAILIQDAGEKAEGERIQTQRVAVYFYDRNHQYNNIRRCRSAVWAALTNKTCAVEGPFTGLGTLTGIYFDERTGMRKDRRLELYYERVVFRAPILLEVG